jgi:hypothetical protein
MITVGWRASSAKYAVGTERNSAAATAEEEIAGMAEGGALYSQNKF